MIQEMHISNQFQVNLILLIFLTIIKCKIKRVFIDFYTYAK